MPYVTISIGSNVERESNIRSCIRALKEHYKDIVFSGIYQNEAVGFSGNDFYNLVARFSTQQDVWSVLETLHSIEIAHGRVHNHIRFGPRSLDIDLLLYDDLIIDNDQLTLPRNEITKYAFVLGPLAEIAGDDRHPVTGKTYTELWQAFDQSKQPLKPVDVAY